MKSFIVLSLLLVSQISFARLVARVVEVQGNAFSFQGKTPTELRYGTEIDDMTELMVEDGSTLSIVSSENVVYHISGGSLVKVYKGVFELKSGYVWIDSKTTGQGIVNTSNSIASFGKGQFIYSFDNVNAKTQLLVLEGDVRFSNSLEPELSTNVTSGYFSLVDPKYQEGLPRTPTKVGLSSYKKTKNVFVGFKSIEDTKYESMIWGEKSVKSSRSIASVMGQSTKKGKLIFIRSYSKGRTPASTGGAMSYYQDIKKKDKSKLLPKVTGKSAPIRYFGKGTQVKKPMKKVKTAKKAPQKTSKRAPASIGSSKIINELKSSGFEQSLNREISNTRRNPDEVNGLIDELKTYKNDFKKEY